MISKYIMIDIDSMIRDYDDNKTSLASITEQYDELCTKNIGSIDYSKDRVQSSNIEDSMATTMILKEDLQNKINGYNRFFAIYDPAWARLTEQEKYILTEFCLACYRGKQTAADRVCDKYNIETRQAYYKFNQAKDRFKRLMFG